MVYCPNLLENTRDQLLEDIEQTINELTWCHPGYDGSDRNQRIVLEIMEPYFERRNYLRDKSD